MDENSNVPEVRSTHDQSGLVCTLTKIDPQRWSEARLKWLWDRLQTQEYAFDDISKLLGHRAFLIPLFDKDSEWYEIGDSGLAVISNIVPKVNACFHYCVWDDIEPRTLFTLQRGLFDDVYTRFQLNRLTANIPSINKQAIRMATLAGFKYEGELRKAFLKDEIYHNLYIYGLLRTEFYGRETRH